MKVMIEIECDEDNEICQHLGKLSKDFKKAIKKRLLTENFELDDNNCYGSHYAIVKEYF